MSLYVTAKTKTKKIYLKWKDIFIALRVTQCQAAHCNIQSKTHSSIDFYASLACGNTVYANTKQMK